MVDEHDRPLGSMEKLEAHRRGRLHRAFSVFIVNESGDLLLQKRAAQKYHSGGLWSNTCCSHPRPGELTRDAAVRRLQEEMGMRCQLDSLFSFVYRSELDHNLIEHEFDHVFLGYSEQSPVPDPNEVTDWRYASVEAIREEIRRDAKAFSAWFRICFDRVATVLSPTDVDRIV